MEQDQTAWRAELVRVTEKKGKKNGSSGVCRRTVGMIRKRETWKNVE